MSLDNFDILLYYYICLCTKFYDVMILFGWLLVLILYKKDYLQFFLNVCLFDFTAVAVSWKVGYL